MEPAKSKSTNKKQTKIVVDYGKVPPQAPEIEESVLGALMIDTRLS